MGSLTRRDVLVVGGGPAGAATAAHLARLGHDVVLCEAARFPREKICGEFLPPSVTPRLERLGVLDAVLALQPARPIGMAVVAPGGARVLGRFGDGAGAGYALRRSALDAVLLAGARRAGVEVLEGTRVLDLAPAGAAAPGAATGGYEVLLRAEGGATRRFTARALVGADGRNSLVARRLSLRRPPRHRRYAIMGRYHDATTPGDHGEMVVTRDGYCGINPLPGGEANVCFVVDPRRARRRGAGAFLPGRSALADDVRRRIASEPALADRLAGARLTGDLLAIGPIACGARRASADAALLVGDAAEFFDPFTGEGVGTALHGAELAAQTLHEGLLGGDLSRRALRRYDALRRRAFASRFRVDRALQRVLGCRRLTDFVAGRLEREPGLADLLAQVTAGLAVSRSLLRPDRVLRFLCA